jgi:dolichyl-diphosphooligosaccharide--protein glycosyltransferase
MKGFWKALLAIGTVALMGLYFRTYSLHGGLPSLQGKPSIRELAARMVDLAIVEQLKQGVRAQSPGLGPGDLQREAETRAVRARLEDKARYEQAVRDAEEKIKQRQTEASPGPVGSASRHYLLEADPYHYYYLTQMLEETGRISSQVRQGKYLNPLGHAPFGHWSAFTLHPYAGFAWYRLVRLFRPSADMMEILAFLPLLLTAGVAVSVYILGRALSCSTAAVWLGMIAVLLSPIFIQRSAFGWYDTDPYNYIFPCLILATYFSVIKNAAVPDRRAIWKAGAAGAFLTGLYALFWTGWAFIVVLIAAASGAVYLGFRIFAPKEKVPEGAAAGRYLLAYGASVLVFAALFMTPAGLAQSFANGWTFLQKFALSGSDLWPNVFLTVGEARGATVKKLIFLTGNYVTFSAASLGFAALGLRSWRLRNPRLGAQWVTLAIFGAALFVMALRTERFSVLFVLPLSMSLMLGADQGGQKLKVYLSSFFKGPRARAGIDLAIFAAGALLILPLTLVTAHVVAGGIRPIMDDVWFAGMNQLRNNTSENAIVNSWWPPGYFIGGVARRRSTADGGTQHFRENYWIARMFLAEDERLAAGILRMLNSSGNAAVESLESAGVPLEEAVKLVESVLSLPRPAARARLAEWAKGRPAAADAERLLNFTHGDGPMPPAYVLVYNDLIEQNIAVSLMANWDFAKARALGKQNSKKGGAAGYIENVLAVAGPVLKYTPEAAVRSIEANRLVFANGLLVDLAARDAYLLIPEKGIRGRPMSFFYLEEGRLVERKNEGELVDAGALLIPDGETFKSVIADPRLIRSMLFRFYYLKGEGLSFFKPFFYQSVAGGTTVAIYQLTGAPSE